MGALLGEELPAFVASLDDPPVRGLRINPAKVGAEELAALLGVELTPVPWCDHGFVLPTGAPALGLHPAIDCGLFYLQDPASMLAPALMAPEAGWRVADVAAAPGGKATDLAARVGPGGLLLANEVVRPRLRLLESALDRGGVGAATPQTAGGRARQGGLACGRHVLARGRAAAGELGRRAARRALHRRS